LDYHAGITVHGFMPRKKYLAILFAVIAIGWVYNFLQVAVLTPGVSVSQFGPGMSTLAFLSGQPPTAMSSLISSLPLCSNFGLSWTVESLTGSILMWFGMVLAMMVPTLLSPGILSPVNINGFIMFLFGYVCIWLVFCILGVALQWGLQAYGVLGASLLINNSSVSAVIFLIIGGVQLFKPKLASLRCWPELSKSTQTKSASFSDDFRAGLNRGESADIGAFL
jgi:predicted metal-binding membrane protein